MFVRLFVRRETFLASLFIYIYIYTYTHVYCYRLLMGIHIFMNDPAASQFTTHNNYHSILVRL